MIQEYMVVIVMNNKITCQQVIDRLNENNISYTIKQFGNCAIIVSKHGGRIFGPFENKESESLSWMSQSFRNSESYKEMIETRAWNIGGERFWIAPELAFFVKERKRFDDTYIVQDAMGFGSYELKENDTEITISQTAQLDVYEMPFDYKKIFMRRTIIKAINPFSESKTNKFPDNTIYCGYHQTFYIKDETPQNSMYVEPWILNQINPGGKLLVPYFGQLDFVDYYYPIDENCQQVHNGYVELNITGKRKFKIAYKAINTFGRSAYVNRLDDGRYYAHFRSYNNNPSNKYCCEPADKPGEKGCSLFVYNDFEDGHGGFGEYENSGLTLGMDTGLTESRCELTTWWFIGAKESIEQIVHTLLGVKYSISI
jgi:hypothetical protein